MAYNRKFQPQGSSVFGSYIRDFTNMKIVVFKTSDIEAETKNCNNQGKR